MASHRTFLRSAPGRIMGDAAIAAALTAAAAGVFLGRNRRANAHVTDNVAPDLRPWISLIPHGPLTNDPPELTSPPARSPRSEALMDAVIPAGLAAAIVLPGEDGAPDVPAFLYDPPGGVRPRGAVLWLHGGGMILGSPWLEHVICNRMAEELGVVVLNPDYRLAPEHPFPAGPDDCFAALAWLHAHAADLGIDPARFAVGGESAGGGLAATVVQMAHDRGLPVAFQALIYPMLDDRTALADRGSDVGRLIWTPGRNRNAWEWYLGHPVRADEDRPYAAASRRADLAGLPPAWIGVGAIDLFHDEDAEFAQRLRDAGGAVEFHEVEGMFHAGDVLGFVPAMKAFRSSMVAALGKAIG